MFIGYLATSSALKRTFFTGPKQLNDVPNVSPNQQAHAICLSIISYGLGGSSDGDGFFFCC